MAPDSPDPVPKISKIQTYGDRGDENFYKLTKTYANQRELKKMNPGCS